jgi:hypothetical protein
MTGDPRLKPWPLVRPETEQELLDYRERWDDERADDDNGETEINVEREEI